jgi:hypothetical protein
MPQPPRNRRDHYVPQGYLRGFIDPARAKSDRPLWCLNKSKNLWERKSPKQICQARGLYDFSNDAIEAEHADVTFKRMEDEFPALRDQLVSTNFVDWREHIDFLLLYMQMIRVRSPQYFVEQGRAFRKGFLARVTSVDHSTNSLTYDATPHSKVEVHDGTLRRMRDEFQVGTAWMAEFHWQLRTTFNPLNPVAASEAPLFVKGTKVNPHEAMTMELLNDEDSEIWFPLCWQAALVGRVRPFDTDLLPFDQPVLNELRHIVAEMAPQFVISPQIVKDLVLDGRSEPRRR